MDTNLDTNTLTDQLKQSLTDKSRGGGPVWSGLLYPDLSHAVVGAAIEVHRHVGPGQLESVYQRALASELSRRRIPAQAQVPIEMLYKGDKVGDFFADFIVDHKIVLELKACDRTHGAHVAQVVSYLRATKVKLGLLMNFNAPVMYRGVRRVILDA
jgi:GxxExxY protein